jgi:hypothetical protein
MHVGGPTCSHHTPEWGWTPRLVRGCEPHAVPEPAATISRGEDRADLHADSPRPDVARIGDVLPVDPDERAPAETVQVVYAPPSVQQTGHWATPRTGSLIDIIA